MKLKINGKAFDISQPKTVFELLSELKIDSQRVAVEVNLSIIKKADYSTCLLNDGDMVEIVNFVGGG